MRSGEKRRRGWDYDPPPPPRAPRSRKLDERATRAPARSHTAGILATLFAILIIVGGLAAFHVVDPNGISLPMAFKKISLPTSFKIGDRTFSLHGIVTSSRQAAPASPQIAPAPPQITPLPTMHNSPDTDCGHAGQCTSGEFAGVIDGLRRQWALVPEDIRKGCAANATYPSVEHCILSQSIPWIAKHPDVAAAWINPKNFDATIMALCQNNPQASPLCSKP